MITFLARFFCKSEGRTAAQLRTAYGVLCGAVGIALNLLLFAGKFFAGTISGSIAITADAFNNLSDAGSSVVTLIGFRLAGQKPDRHHPFGHGRVEYLSGLAVSVVILLMGFELGKTSFEKILSPAPVEFSLLPVIILPVSILVKGWMYLFNRKLGKKLAGVRLDTSGSMVDKSLWTQIGTFKPTGVCKELVCNVRRALDAEGFNHVKIIASGGFDAERVAAFEEMGVPVDTYAVGSSFFDGNINYTADIVKVDGKDCAKAGRKYNPNPKMELVK